MLMTSTLVVGSRRESSSGGAILKHFSRTHYQKQLKPTSADAWLAKGYACWCWVWWKFLWAHLRNVMQSRRTDCSFFRCSSTRHHSHRQDSPTWNLWYSWSAGVMTGAVVSDAWCWLAALVTARTHDGYLVLRYPASVQYLLGILRTLDVSWSRRIWCWL